MAPNEQEEIMYYALRPASLREQERDQMWREMQEWEQRNQVTVIPFGKSAYSTASPDSHKADSGRYAIRQPENRGGAHNKEIDLTGKRFGRLVVARRSGDRSLHGYWVCDCDCGRRDQFEKKRLIESRIRQCRECDRLERLKEKQRNKKTAAENDLHGKKFHKLTVLGMSETKITNKKAWDVRCDCGTILPVITYKLTSGVRKSCGKCKHEKKK